MLHMVCIQCELKAEKNPLTVQYSGKSERMIKCQINREAGLGLTISCAHLD
jgi:hypothetical protein